MDTKENGKKDKKLTKNGNWKKDTALFLSSQTISLFGSSLVQYAMTWYITLKTQSGVMMTLSIICGFLPTFFISPFSGVWADRYNRKLLITLSDSLIAVSTLVLAVLFFMGYDSLWLIFAASAIRSLGAGVQQPAVGAILPDIVPEDALLRVNGVNSSIQSLVFLISPMLSGVLFNWADIESIFLIDVVTAAIAVGILTLFLRIPTHARVLEKQEVSYFKDMHEGIRYIGSQGFLKNIFIFSAGYFILATPLSFLTGLHVTRRFGSDVMYLTGIEIAFSVGMLVGGLVIASWGGFKNKLYTMSLSNFVTSFCTIGMGLVPAFWIYLVLMGLVGFVMPMFNTPFTVLLQQKVEPGFMGRVFGVFSMLSSSIMPLSMLVYGPLADIIRIEWILLVTGFFLLILSMIMLRNRVLIEACQAAEE